MCRSSVLPHTERGLCVRADEDEASRCLNHLDLLERCLSLLLRVVDRKTTERHSKHVRPPIHQDGATPW